ncbi:MAG: pyridoxal-5'-phosphate-dependent protein subunit beta, partial [Negativicutes bacterium]|nr:pyridoxal-5'-phosphate-dependent protein subunit beta [Negativicutes bacterium]
GHNIQGIGDKHIPFIHNVMNTDLVAGVSDLSTDSLYLLFNKPEGQEFLRQYLAVDDHTIYNLSLMGLSSICNVLAAIKLAKYYDLGDNDVVLTVATDPAFMYRTEGNRINARLFNGQFDYSDAAVVFGRHLAGVATDHLVELGYRDRLRIFNLGYFTWVEQQGVSVEEFSQRRDQSFWRDLKKFVPIWDRLINEFNSLVIA